MPDLKTEEKSFEEKLAEVQGIVKTIEEGKLPLAETMQEYERGMSLMKNLEAELEQVQRRISVLRTGADGQAQEQPL